MTGVELILGLVLGVAAVIVEYAPKIIDWYKARGTKATDSEAKADGPAAE
jgi:hypothetical protein